MASEIIEFEIPNFEKYHPNKGYKKTPWIRLEVDIWDDPGFSLLTATQMLCYIYLVTRCGRVNTGFGSCSVRVASSSVRVKPKLFLVAVSRLVELQLVKYSGETQKGSYERNVTNETNVTKRKGSKTNKNQKGQKEKKDPPAEGAEPKGTANSKAIAYFCDLWKAKYNAETSPTITKKEAGIITRMVKSMSLNKVQDFMDAYFSMPDTWIVKNAHPIALLESKKMEIHRYMQSGAHVNVGDMRTMDRKISNKKLFDKFEGNANGN